MRGSSLVGVAAILLLFGVASVARAENEPVPESEASRPAAPEPTLPEEPQPDAAPREIPPVERETIDLTPPASAERQGRESPPKARVLADPCAAEDAPPENAMVDRARDRLYRTACGAARWFDGLFGDQAHPDAARNVTGRAEVSVIGSEFEGARFRGRFNLRARFPNLEERVEAFLGRDDEDEFVRDRTQGLALRSQFLDLEGSDSWLAGLGYSLPGSYRQRTDFRVGGRVSTAPEIFVQGRHRRNWFLSERNVLRFRETIFWTNRDGFGSTTGVNFDRLLSKNLLVRLGNVGTWSEASEGLDWRSALIFYQHLRDDRALAYEAFTRGKTDAEVPVREYGLRTIYRQSILGRSWLFGELVLGYSWPQERLDEPREGSAAVGFGIEMLYGRD
jgi:hypothetical protein